jgi:hypothetical protein
MDLNLPDASTLISDGGFLDRLFEAALLEEAGIHLIVPRRKNMKDQLDGCTAYVCRYLRKRGETTFSQLAERLAGRFMPSRHGVLNSRYSSPCWHLLSLGSDLD